MWLCLCAAAIAGCQAEPAHLPIDATLQTVQDDIFTPACAPSGCHDSAVAGQLDLRTTAKSWSEELLQRSAKVSLLPPGEGSAARKLGARIENLAGHALPSGATAERQMWLEVIVRANPAGDGQGAIVFESGTLDELGDLRDDFAKHTTMPGTDPQLVVYRQLLYSDPTREDPPGDGPRVAVDMPWQANSWDNFMVPADGTDERFFVLPEAVAGGGYKATVRLLFRSFPPYFLRGLEASAGLDPAEKTRLPIVEMWAGEVSW